MILTNDSIYAIIMTESQKGEAEMYSVEFYETDDGKSDVWDFLEELRENPKKARTLVYNINKSSFA